MEIDRCQFPTPVWVAEALIERHFPDLDATDLVLDPTCGPAGFLAALPSHVPGVGVEIDPVVAEHARASSGRRIITGDFLAIDLDLQPTAIIGNPPFRGQFIDRFLDRCYTLLPRDKRVGLILPAYALRTASRVSSWLDRWSVSQEMLPRSAFCQRMREPLVFAIFSKDTRRVLVGFALYEQESDRQLLAQCYRTLLASQTGSKWRAVCQLALERLGGEATLAQIYAELERNRPTRTTFWREKIRQTLRVYSADFLALATGRYCLAGGAA